MNVKCLDNCSVCLLNIKYILNIGCDDSNDDDREENLTRPWAAVGGRAPLSCAAFFAAANISLDPDYRPADTAARRFSL